MDKFASEQYLARDLARISSRANREGWTIIQNGLLLEAVIPKRTSGEIFRLFFICKGYPNKPVQGAFLPTKEHGAKCKWPDDREYVFRSKAPIPFICLPGLMTYSPEGISTNNPYSKEDLVIGAILGRIADAINDERCSGIVLRGPEA